MEECVFGAAVSETGRIGPEAAAYIKKEPCMLNEDKIKLMTELALFEKKHASQMKTVNQYFKSDYISRNLLRGFISYTLCSILLFGMWVLFNVEVVLSSIGMDELKGLAFRGGALYLGGLFLYVVLTIIVYGGRYEYEEKRNRIYIAKLKHLDKRYDIHRRARKWRERGEADERTPCRERSTQGFLCEIQCICECIPAFYNCLCGGVSD